jgi:hypothetical protein
MTVTIQQIAADVERMKLRGISHNEFFDRFTNAERIAWRILRDDAEAVAPASRTETQHLVLISFDYFMSARAVEMDHPNTVAGVLALRLWGVLAGDWRVTEVLAGLEPDSTAPED